MDNKFITFDNYDSPGACRGRNKSDAYLAIRIYRFEADVSLLLNFSPQMER